MSRALPGRAIRHSRRRPDLVIPASRERNRAAKARTTTVRELLDAQRLCARGQRKRCRNRSATSSVFAKCRTIDPETVRFFILRAHYRGPLNYSDQHLQDAKQSLDGLYITLRGVPPKMSSSTGTTPMRQSSSRPWMMISILMALSPCCSSCRARRIKPSRAGYRVY